MNVGTPAGPQSPSSFDRVMAARRGLGLSAAKRIAFLLLFSGAAFGFARLSEGRSLGFEKTGNLATARTPASATLLPNGKVLFVGTEVGNSQSRATELYDPSSGTWSATGRPSSVGSGHTATLLLNGKVLAVGGHGYFIYASGGAALYDPATGTWTQTQSVSARHSHTATLLPNGKVRQGVGCGRIFPGERRWRHSLSGNGGIVRSGHRSVDRNRQSFVSTRRPSIGFAAERQGARRWWR
jgi:hypothetical protein